MWMKMILIYVKNPLCSFCGMDINYFRFCESLFSHANFRKVLSELLDFLLPGLVLEIFEQKVFERQLIH